MKYLDPKADLTFKKIFGNHPDRLKNLLNTLQSLNEDGLIQQQHVPTRPERAEAPGAFWLSGRAASGAFWAFSPFQPYS